MKRLFLLSLLLVAVIVAGCEGVPTGSVPATSASADPVAPVAVATEVPGTEITLQVGKPLNLEIENCPSGNRTTLFNDLIGVGPDGANFVGSGFVTKGGEIQRTVDCGSGNMTYAFAKVISFDSNSQQVTVLRYSQPVKR